MLVCVIEIYMPKFTNKKREILYEADPQSVQHCISRSLFVEREKMNKKTNQGRFNCFSEKAIKILLAFDV